VDRSGRGAGAGRGPLILRRQRADCTQASQTAAGCGNSAEIDIALDAGHLRIGVLAQPSALIAGEIAYPDRNQVVHDFTVRGDTATFTLHEQDSQLANSDVGNITIQQISQ
jgi:hypothetical protein